MNRIYTCLYALAFCQAALIGAPTQKAQPQEPLAIKADAQEPLKEKYNHLQHDFNDMVKAKHFSDYQLSCSNQKLAHILAFSDMQKKSLEARNNELAKKTYAQDATLAEKNKQIMALFKEIEGIRKMLNNSLVTRNHLERAYLNLDQKLQVTQQTYAAQTKHLNHKLIDVQTAKATSLMTEAKALAQVARLEQALKDTEEFYTTDMYKTFDALAYELEETRKQLTIATDATFETERELAFVKKQLETAQSLIANGGVSAKSEKDLKTIQASLAKLSKEATESQGSYHAQLTQAIEHIKKLDYKLNKAQAEAEKNQKDIQQRAAREAKHSQDFKAITADLAKIKREYQANLAQNTIALTKTIKSLETELQTTKAQASRAAKTMQAKDIAFGTLDRHSKRLQTLVAQEEQAHQSLLQKLNSKELEVKNANLKLTRLESTEKNLRALVSKTQQELSEETQKTKALGLQLKNVSQKLASAELAKDKALFQAAEITKENDELSKKLAQSEADAFVLKDERNLYMFERHTFARMAKKAVDERNAFASRYDTLLKTVYRAQEDAKTGVSEAHPAGIAFA